MSRFLQDDLLKLPFDQYQRYRRAAEIIQAVQNPNGNSTLLEVGGFPPLIQNFLPDAQVSVLDRPAHNHTLYLRGDGLNLPFRDKAFATVLSLDVLEHIQPGQRPRLLEELERCANGLIVLAAPFGNPQAREAEKILLDFIRTRAGYEHNFFKEHLEIEPPRLADTELYFKSRGYEVCILPSGRLDRWFLMLGLYYFLDSEPGCENLLANTMSYYNRYFYASDNTEPCYRYFVVAAAGRGLEKRLAELNITAGETEAEPAGLEPLHAIIRGLLLDKNRERKGRIAELENLLSAKDAEIQGLREHIGRLTEFADRVKSLPLYKLYERFFKGPRV